MGKVGIFPVGQSIRILTEFAEATECECKEALKLLTGTALRFSIPSTLCPIAALPLTAQPSRDNSGF